MKSFRYNNETYKAEKIYKREKSIVGYDNTNREVFAIRNITRFDDFVLDNQAEFDTEISLEERVSLMQKAIDDLTIGGVK